MSDGTRQTEQTFTVSHHDEADFHTDGLRPYAAYRDLGIETATKGMATASVIRMVRPFEEQYGKRHYHDVELQLIYVLKGWYRVDFGEDGVHTMKEGTCWLQPPGIRHTVTGWSDDCELLEIVLPADFKTGEDRSN